MRLMHFTDHELTTPAESLAHLYPGPIEVTQRPGPKPAGFWLSDERGGFGWKQWCRSEDFRPRQLAYEYYVKLTGKERILYVRSVEQLDAFTKKYRADSDANRFSVKFDADYRAEHPETSMFRSGPTIYDIDWPRVKADGWQGIIITPYRWERRLTGHTMWYYGWDCASGCIWDPAAIGGFRLKTLHWKLLELYEPDADERRQEMNDLMAQARELMKELPDVEKVVAS
jgi:hypothetical protein